MSDFDNGDIDPYVGQDLASRIANVGSPEELSNLLKGWYVHNQPQLEGNHAYYTSNVNNDINDVELDSDGVWQVHWV